MRRRGPWRARGAISEGELLRLEISGSAIAIPFVGCTGESRRGVHALRRLVERGKARSRLTLGLCLAIRLNALTLAKLKSCGLTAYKFAVAERPVIDAERRRLAAEFLPTPQSGGATWHPLMYGLVR